MKQNSSPNISQINASQPKNSTWVSANAGSGKTKVLIDRVTRLLLNQTLPQHILCLTYTKAAASHMQNKLFERLGAWSMLSDENLLIELNSLGEEKSLISHQKLIQARQLFAGALDAPGGLKIQTIHSFCASILRRFPLEAGISPNFIELDERNTKLIQTEILDNMAANDVSGIFTKIASILQILDINTLLNEISKYRQLLSKNRSKEEIFKTFDIKPSLKLTDILETGFSNYDSSIIKTGMHFLELGSANDIKVAEKLKFLNLDVINLDLLSNLSDIFLSKNEAASPLQEKSFPTIETLKAVGSDLDEFIKFKSEFCINLKVAKILHINLSAAKDALLIYEFSKLYLTNYENIKSQKCYLDFDDQILLVKMLLSQSSMAQWVMYKLDGGIEHILIDEAQDTSPDQWDVIKLLTDEFNAGEAKKNKPRTIFAVGDEKQSIYSFQGADPFAFEQMRRYFSDKLIEANDKLSEQRLLYSFRSSPIILKLVDKVLKEGGSSLNLSDQHIAFKDELPGRVDLWPFIDAERNEEPSLWFEPIDSKKPNNPNLKLAEKIAAEIKYILDSKQILGSPNDCRIVQPGDFLILLRSRNFLFHSIIKCLKISGLPVAGADRLNIATELAVKDLLSLLNFLVTPDDDLNLATLLKSPLCGLSENELFHLAKGREGSLWKSLLKNANQHKNILNFLSDLRNNVDFLRPYELLERALIKHNKRADLTSTLGLEAEDGINALLDQALNYEKLNIPDLTSFILWMESDDVYIKRELETESSNIRVMTIHGAKGLEAPIVILPDTGSRLNMGSSKFIKLNDNIITLRGAKPNQPQLVKNSIEELNKLEKEEEFRLLYVAMTRAESWLIICGSGRRNKNGGCWYDTIENGIKSLNIKTDGHLEEARLTIQSKNWKASDSINRTHVKSNKNQLPKWVNQPKTQIRKTNKAISPSEMEGSKSLNGSNKTDSNNAKMVGSQIHILIEYLPKFPHKNWKSISYNILKNSGYGNIKTIEKATDRAIKILHDDKLKFLFQSNSIAEAPFQVNIPELNNTLFSGIIDRIVVLEEKIIAVDFKSNFLVPKMDKEVPNGLLRQMAIYFRSLEIIYPAKEINIAILWTETSNLMFLDKMLLKKCLQSVLNT